MLDSILLANLVVSHNLMLHRVHWSPSGTFNVNIHTHEESFRGESLNSLSLSYSFKKNDLEVFLDFLESKGYNPQNLTFFREEVSLLEREKEESLKNSPLFCRGVVEVDKTKFGQVGWEVFTIGSRIFLGTLNPCSNGWSWKDNLLNFHGEPWKIRLQESEMERFLSLRSENRKTFKKYVNSQKSQPSRKRRVLLLEELEALHKEE